jgi:hypothetical protein
MVRLVALAALLLAGCAQECPELGKPDQVERRVLFHMCLNRASQGSGWTDAAETCDEIAYYQSIVLVCPRSVEK